MSRLLYQLSYVAATLGTEVLTPSMSCILSIPKEKPSHSLKNDTKAGRIDSNQSDKLSTEPIVVSGRMGMGS